MSAMSVASKGLKVISGGQTGAERAALDAALAQGLSIGGWCTRDRWAEDGAIPDHYPLAQTRTEDLHVRTMRNVECSSATLLLTRGSLMGACRLSADTARSVCRPLLVVDLEAQSEDPVDTIVGWLKQVRPAVLNVSGPRESNAPGIYEQALCLLNIALDLSSDAQDEAPAFHAAHEPSYSSFSATA